MRKGTLINMPRGIKTCQDCGETTGPRTKKCKKCGYVFHIKKGASKRRGKSCDWRKLSPGDLIRVIQGTGPTFNGRQEDLNMGYKGKFTVAWLDNDGIHAFRKSNHAFIYMGKSKKVKDTGIHRMPHKILLVKKAA